MKALNQEKALVEAFSVIVKTDCETDGWSAALVYTNIRRRYTRVRRRYICTYINIDNIDMVTVGIYSWIPLCPIMKQLCIDTACSSNIIKTMLVDKCFLKILYLW